MKYRLLPLIGALAAACTGAGMAGNDAAGRGTIRPPFRIVFVDQLDPRSRTLINRSKTRSGIAALQAALTADPALSRKLRARGIAIRNIIRREDDGDGRTTFYVR
jgi:hypothetical protein